MDEDVEFSITDLEKCSYRGLQQLAKSMQLPSNFKKIYLIQLIYAKKHCSDADVEAIVQKVRLERQLASQASKRKGKKKMRVQGSEVSSTNICLSPPISSTPKRPGLIICHPFINTTFSKPQNARVYSNSTQQKSDRVLRSFNYNAYKQRRYSYLNDNPVIGVNKTPKKKSDTEMIVISQDRSYPKLSMTTKCIVSKLRPSFSGLKQENQLVPVSGREICLNRSNNKPKTPENISRDNFECVQSVGFRRKDGKISKINAIVQKNIRTKPPKTATTENYSDVEVTIQDIINSNIDSQKFTNTNITDYVFSESTIAYPNTSNVTDYSNQMGTPETPSAQRYSNTPTVTDYNNQNIIETPNTQNETTERERDREESFSVYFHKKIRAEHVKQRIQRVSLLERDARLPKIGEVFTSFQSSFSKDVTEPLYVQVGEDSKRTNYPRNVGGNQGMLEPLYNFKPSMLVHAPLYPITTTHTRCVFSTPVYVTAVAQSSTMEQETAPSSYEQNRRPQCTNDDITKMCEYLRLAEQEITLRKYHEALALTTSTSSPESQDMGLSATEMVEDALELISQDGDYMERISMDVRMQCILCSWAGPKIVLDLHVGKDHANDIVKQDRSEWNTTYRLGSLTDQPLWLSEVRELDGRRYALSVKREADWLLVSLSTLTLDPDPKMGAITIFNKVTGQPYAWEGPIQLLPTNMPYENDGYYLRVEVDQLDLVPRNPELKSTNKVVGKLDLNDVYVIIFVKIS